LENFSFTFNDAKDYATSENWPKIFMLTLIREPFASVNVAQW
jgi:hypothetical protein